jgi:hypothetical protein
MATKNARKVPAAEPAMSRQPWDWAGDFSRQQMAAASEGASVLFRGFEAMRRIQEEAAHEAAERHAAAAEKMRKPSSPSDLALVQAETVRDDLASAARCWRDLADAALEMNSELLNCATQLMNADDLLAATSARFLHS